MVASRDRAFKNKSLGQEVREIKKLISEKKSKIEIAKVAQCYLLYFRSVELFSAFIEQRQRSSGGERTFFFEDQHGENNSSTGTVRKKFERVDNIIDEQVKKSLRKVEF